MSITQEHRDIAKQAVNYYLNNIVKFSDYYKKDCERVAKDTIDFIAQSLAKQYIKGRDKRQ